MGGTMIPSGQPGGMAVNASQRNGSVSHLSISTSKIASAAQNAIAAEPFSPVSSQPPSSMASAFPFSLTPIGQPPSYEATLSRQIELERMASNMNGSQTKNGVRCGAAILMRRLPRNTSHEALRSMLLFAKDLIDAEFVHEMIEEGKFLTAVARFETMAAAEEARQMLDGKPNTANDSNMIVDIISGSSASSMMPRRNTIDHVSTRMIATTMSPPTQNGVGPGTLSRQTSRFNEAFQTLDQISTGSSVTPNGELPAPDSNSRIHSLFSPQSPIGNTLNDRPRVSGKSMIDQDIDEDDTGELLKDPVGYARNGPPGSMGMTRRSTNPSIPVARFANISVSTNISPAMQSLGNTRSAVNIPTPSSAMSPSVPSMGSSAGFHHPNQYHRLNYPAANPADQNPPCNTLYVGNLPHDTSEDELKALFSKQRGYKRLCFRNKQNGPMCFVEFEDVSFATKALHELYGYQLSNSVKGGIRLSFSKNPLGVRNSQPNNMSPATPMNPPAARNGLANMQGPMFSTANGPPPGLSAPPGLPMPMGNNGIGPTHHPLNSATVNGSFNVNTGLGIGTNPNGMGPMRSAPLNGNLVSGSIGQTMGGMNGATYPDYMMGR
ncbi:hypothetical protein AJ80_06272 [Polytolypa hystricis UAMH7299]|uniref:RRM domain-containing protein n=1 Tax=Polytolypa hystricis (strain UAMH7299) TaxID=1447883 RepID=A0A2B7XY23_POLH7|nr:hypothetical protein AJ80_06272 [Polytolypa hystricis UAMH7299]